MITIASRRLYVAYLAFAVALVIAAAGLVVLVNRQQDIALQAQIDTLERTSEALATHVAALVQNVLGSANEEQAIHATQELIDGYRLMGDVFNIRVSRSDRAVLAAMRRKNLEKPEGLPIMLTAFGGSEARSYETVDGVRNFCVAVPLKVGGQPWGAVVVYRSLDPTYATLRAANQRILWVTGLTFAALVASIGGLLWYASLEVRNARSAEARQSRLALMGTMAASVAHEIRNPLNALTLAIDYLKRRARTAPEAVPISDLADDLSSMQHEVNRLEQVVRDFADLSREPRIELQATSLRGAIEHVVNLFGPLARQREINLSARYDDGGLMVNADVRRMEQVLVNLVKNAIEATPAQGSVEVRTAADDNGLVIEVADTGTGIPPERQALLFEPFQTSRAQGLGLGLFLSKRLVEAHGATLTMSSRPGVGTTFRIVLPAPVAQLSRAA